jgi:hypothetical protein
MSKKTKNKVLGCSGELWIERDRPVYIRYIGVNIPKTKFAKIVKEQERTSLGYILRSITETGNKYEIELANKYPGKVVVYSDQPGWRYGEVLKIIDIRK